MIRVSIVGASGYTGAELVRWLVKHPQVQRAHLAVRRDPLPVFSDLFPEFRGVVDQNCFPMEESQIILDESDVIFFALPHKTTMDIMPQYLGHDKLLIDLSGDYRLKDAKVYRESYGVDHQDQGNLGTFTYGLSEIYTEAIRSAKTIANPGCFPTGAQLALYPFLKEKVIKPTGIIIDAKTGVSGGGKTPQQGFHFPECDENFKAYKMGAHPHEPEIEQSLSDASNVVTDVLFVAHLAPMIRGIYSTIYTELTQDLSEDALHQLLQKTYADKPFVRVLSYGVSPEVKHVAHSNFCDVSCVKVGQTLVLMSAIDNLVKGAAGQAVQNMNIALGFEETTGLL